MNLENLGENIMFKNFFSSIAFQLARVQVLLLLVAATLISIVLFGLAFYVCEDVDLHTSWYWSVITFYTIGFGDIAPKTMSGRVVASLFAATSDTLRLMYGAYVAAVAISWADKSRRGEVRIRGKDLILIINPVDAEHVQAVIEALRSKGLNNKIVIVSQIFEHAPALPHICGSVSFVRGNPLHLETLERAGLEHAVGAIVCPTSFNNTESDRQTAAVVKLIEQFDKRIATVAEVLVANQQRWLQRADWCVDEIVLVDRVICRAIAIQVKELMADRPIILRFQAYDAAKQAEFIEQLHLAGVMYTQVVEEQQADIDVVFSSNLDDPSVADPAAMIVADDSVANQVLVEYLSVKNAGLFEGYNALCLDQLIAAAVALALAKHLS